MGRMSLTLTERAEKRRRQVLSRSLAGQITRRRRPPEMAMTVEDAASASTKQKGRSTNYTEAEDIALVKAWDVVKLDDAAAGNDQTGKGYWKRITNEFHRLMQPETSSRSLRSLQGRYGDIKQLCSRWSACLEQVRSAPPSGCASDDYDRVAQERYKQIAASRGKAFGLQHCWKLLEHSEKWKLMDEEGTPLKKRRSNSPANELDDDGDGDDGDGEGTPASTGNIGRSDERMKGKNNLMLLDQEIPPPKKRRSISPTTDLDDDDDDDDADVAAADDDEEGIETSTRNIWEKIDELMKGRNEVAAQPLQMKKQSAETKQQDKMIMWQEIREIEEKKMATEKRKMDLEERRLLLEENKLRQEIIGEENKLMMMDPNGMDETTRAWWDIRRGEILQSKLWDAGSGPGRAPP